MAETPSRRGNSLWVQIILVGLVVVALVWLFIALGVTKPKGTSIRLITYKIEGASGAGVVTYTKEDGQASGILDVSVPWHLDLRIPSRTVVVLTAGNPSQLGNLTCVILLDGGAWKTQTAKAPGDKISCAGIVP